MNSVEKRRSGRKSSGNRKHSDGGYSDTSSGGSFLDETDREVSNLTDRAFRSLCIGDEAVYNDSDLSSSSPCTQRDKQLAFSQSGQDREREELKRAAHESFGLRVQQYGEDWIHGGICGTEIHRDPQWEAYGGRTQGKISATFQHSFVETSQQEKSLRQEHLPFLSNGATELSSHQRRSHSRVSSLIRAFNSEGQRDGAGMDNKLREWNDETSWDKSALMSIKRELSEFSTYQQNFNSGQFPSSGPFSSSENNFYSSEVAALAHMNSASSFMRSSHSKRSMSAQVSCNSNFFIHSEFSPFKVWRDHNRFPFQEGEVSGFMHCSEFPKWYETPMYKELSLETQPQGPYRFDKRCIRNPRNNLTLAVPPTPPRSTSTSTVLQKALALEKRCESELASYYPHRKRAQSLGTNRLPSQRPLTASPPTEMPQHVQDTMSSVESLRQKIKMMTEQNMTTGMTTTQQAVLYSNENLIPSGNTAIAAASNVVSGNTSRTSFNISQQVTPFVHTHQEVETTDVGPYAVSPQPVEHPPVRAESRGATPDVRMSNYKSRATSLLFNLKDNRKRIKSTYSPTKFKGFETVEKNKPPFMQEPRDTVIDIPDFLDPDIQGEESSRTSAAAHQYVNQCQSHGLSLNCQSVRAHAGRNSEYTLSDYQTVQMQGEMVHHSGFIGFIPENYSSNQLANGQNLHEDLSSFTPYKQGMTDNVEPVGGDVYRFKPSYTVTEMPRPNADNNPTREYLISKANAEQKLNETLEREFTKVDRYQQQDNKYDYSNVSSQDRWRQTNSRDTEKLTQKTALSPWKQEITALIEKDQLAQAYQRAAVIKEEQNLPRDKYKEDNEQSINKQPEKTGFGLSSHKNTGMVNPTVSNQLPQYVPFNNDTLENQAYYGQQQPGASMEKYMLQKFYGHNEENEINESYLTQNYNKYTDQEYRNQHSLNSEKDKTRLKQSTGQRTQYIPRGHEMQSVTSVEPKSQFEHNMQKPLSNPDNVCAFTMAKLVKDRQFDEVKSEQTRAEHIKYEHAQAGLAKAQPWAQVQQPKAESAELILGGQTGSEKVKAEPAKTELTEHERVKPAIAEHIKEEKRKAEQTEQFRKKQPEQSMVQRVTEESVNTTEKTGANNVKVEQVRAEQAEAERLKENMTTEQAKREQAEQTRGERRKAKVEPGEAEFRKAEQVKLEQKNEQQMKAKQEKMKAAEVGKLIANPIIIEDYKIRQGKADKGSTMGQVNAEQLVAGKSKVKEAKVEERKAEQTKLEQTKVERAIAELTKRDNLQERSVKAATKLIVTQQNKSEPDKVEQVKTELAKAKAELAKIKEKMRGEQISRNEDYKKKEQVTQMHQWKGALSRNPDQTDENAVNYDHLREKCSVTNATSDKNKVSTPKTDSSKNTTETSALLLDNVETISKKSNDEHSPTKDCATADMENKEVGSFKSKEVTESHYIYSESSKEFKLTSANYLPPNLDNRANSVTHAEKSKDDSVEKLEKCDPVKPTDASQHKDSDFAKTLPLGRRSKSTEHSVVPGKEPHYTPPRALSHKEKVQTKQEILTSKIKAHAEKEISAIKEKGFAIRDGFISKNSSKQLPGSQSINIRQKPLSQEVSKILESTSSDNITPNHQVDPSGIMMELVKSVSPSSSSIMPVKSATTISQLEDQVPKEPLESNDNVPEPCREGKQPGSYSMSTDEGLVENQKKENQAGIKLPMQSNEQVPENKQEKHDTNHGGNYGNQKEVLKDNHAIKTDHLKKKEVDPSPAAAVGEAENSSHVKTEGIDSEHEAAPEDSAPSLSLVYGQNKTPVDDDSLQIMGIMVTVRERKPSLNNVQEDNSVLEQINAKEIECRNSVLNKSPTISGLEESKEKSSNETDIAKSEDSVLLEPCPTVKENETKVDINYYPENMQEILTPETRKDSVSEDITEKRTDFQQESTCRNARLQRETQLQEPLAEKGVHSTVNVPAKNKALTETQPLFYNQDPIGRENRDSTDKTPTEYSEKSTAKNEVKSYTNEKNPPKSKTAHTDENKMVNTVLDYKNESDRADPETQIKQDVQLPVKDVTTVTKPSISRNIDGKIAPLVGEQRHDSTPTPANLFDQTIASTHLTEKENRHTAPKIQSGETKTGENNQVDANVHIDSIAIRVVPAVTEKVELNILENEHITNITSDVVEDNGNKQVASISCEEKVNNLNNEERANGPTPANSEKQMKDILEDKIQEQYSVKKLSDSLKIDNQQNSINVTCENTQAENGNPERSVKSEDESKLPTLEVDYFQVQGVKETNNEIHNSANVGVMSDGVSKAREFPGLLPNKAPISNESYKEGKNEVFVLAQTKRQTADSSSISVENEKMKRKNLETKDNLPSKPSDAPTERQSNNEKMEASQDNHIRKHHTERESSLSARERQSSRNVYPTRENAVKVKPEVKPKPKERTSTIPEISAIADYARLKVIVSEDRANTIQEFAPNKKEGFFPLIQSRHSRRPVFTPDPKDLSAKEKSLPNKTEVSAKVNKEPKTLVFPITEKEHQRTGMFKLGDKERRDKMFFDAKFNEKQPTKERGEPSPGQTVAGPGTQRVSQVDQTIHQLKNDSSQTTISSSAVNRTMDASEEITYLDKKSQTQPTVGQIFNMEESMTTLIKDERIEIQKGEDTETKAKDGMTDKLKQERFAVQKEEMKATQQGRIKLSEYTSRIEVEKRAEDMRTKHMTESSRAFLAEVEKRSGWREEERRAKEREAIAIKIKETQEKQQEAEKRAEDEIKEKQNKEEDKAAQKEEEMREKQRGEGRIKEETEQKRRTKFEEKKREKLRGEKEQMKENEKRRWLKLQEEGVAKQEQQRRAALEEQHQKRAALEEQQRRAALEEQHQKRAALEEQQRRAALEEQQRRAALEEQHQKRAALEEQQRRAALEEQQRRAALEEQHQRRVALEEQQRRAALEDQQRRAALEEQQRRAALEEHQRRAALEEQQRRAALEEQHQKRAALEDQQKRAALEEQQRRAALEEHQRRAALEEQQRRAALEEQHQKRAALEDQQKRAALEEQQRRALLEEHQRRAALEEQQKRAALEEQHQKRAALEEQQKRAALEEQQRRAALEEQHQKRAALEEQQKRSALEEQQRRAALEEQHQKRAALEEQQKRAALEEQQKRAALEEQQKRAALEEQQRRAALEEHQRRVALEEQQRRAALEEQHQKRAALEEQQRRAALEEQHQKRAALEEQQRRAALEEQQKRAALEEHQRRAALEEQQRRAALEEQQRRVALEEQQRRAALEEQQRRAALEEQQRRAALEEQQRRAALEEQQRRAALEEQHQKRAAPEEQQRRAALEEQQRRAALEEHQRRAAQEGQQMRAALVEQHQKRAALEEKHQRAAQKEQQRRTAQENQQRRAALVEQQMRAALEEQQRKVAQEKQQRRAALGEQQRRVVQEEQQRRGALIEGQRRAKQTGEKILSDLEEDQRRKQRQDKQAAQISEEKSITQIQEKKKAEQQTEEQLRERQKKEWLRTQRKEDTKATENVTIIKQIEENQGEGESTRLFEESCTALKEEEKVAQELKLIQKDAENGAINREEGKSFQVDEHKRAEQMMDTLQYYAITSTNSERKLKERQLQSPIPSQQSNNLSGLESYEDSGPHIKSFRPRAPASPAPSLPRSNTSSPAPGAKPSMFRVKDNTMRGSSLTKSVKPRFHKNFGEDFRVGSPMERRLERPEDEQEIIRHSAVTPILPDAGLKRFAPIKESSASQQQDHSAALPQQRPFSRRSIALDEDDSRSVISNMSQDVESFATSAADLADIRHLYDYERPESVCSFSSDMSHSLGKPPAVPPKSEKALQRAKRLTSRRMRKEISKTAADSPRGAAEELSVQKPLPEASNTPCSSSSNSHAVASPHFSPPVSIPYAPVLGSNVSPSQTEHQASHRTVHASPHATGPISLPVASPHTIGPASHTAAPKTIAHVPSSPIQLPANHAVPVTQYHVESNYLQSYPLTQRKVLQDLGSGQYFVVDVPVQVKTKTFFDPETGKYVQLNVRESGQNMSQPQSQQTYPQHQLQPQMHQQTISQGSPPGKPLVLYQSNHCYPQGYQPINSMVPSAPQALQQDQQPVRENHNSGYPAPEMRQNSQGNCYSPEKTPYMDTVNDTDKTYNPVYNTHGSNESFPECDTNSQLAGSSVCENDNSAHSRYLPRDIITMSELEDFMEVSDW
ncbi:cardiac-enriched FHL2-interacting protein [Mastacembelus armatus]|uniref:cardiac-enriched FHL2-interacting protein n=1 Tax=Mastacembelus armatus TaxID=205130 RepID=UPI000E453F92|nr:uncharacterized protein LOC113131609 [Mastacembelus armatus]